MRLAARFIATMAVAFVMVPALHADTPKVEWFLGYSFWRAMPTATSNRMSYLHGGSTSVAYNFNRYIGLVADFGGYDDSRLTFLSPTGNQTVDSSGSAYTYMFGPRFSYRRYERFTPFFQALFGGTYASSVTISGCTPGSNCTPLGSENAFAAMLGAGFDIKITHHIALRPFEGDFLLTHFKNPFSAGGQAWDGRRTFDFLRESCFASAGTILPRRHRAQPLPLLARRIRRWFMRDPAISLPYALRPAIQTRLL